MAKYLWNLCDYFVPMWVVAQCRCLVMLATMLLSHAGDDAAEATLPRRDADVEKC
jgi:hypothetical protein